jgi:hypothetical protein
MTGASYVHRVQQALAAAPGRRLQGHRIAAAIGVTTQEFHKRAGKIAASGGVSREKIRDSGHAYFWYFLSDVQLARYRLSDALARVEETEGSALVIDEADLPSRLVFLRRLREQTVFRDHAVLAAIIGDYERTARMRHALDI